jgi:hypothetical protein
VADDSRSRPRKPQFPATPTVYNGIDMRSRLEAGYAAWLDKRGWRWTYERQHGAFASGKGQYYPDFRIEGVLNLMNDHEAVAYVETKPSYAGLDLDQLARRMSVIWSSEPDAHVLLQAPPPHESMHIQAGRAGLSREGAVFDASAYVFSLVRTDPPQWCAVVWISNSKPILGYPLPVGMGPWAGEYWNVA